MSTAIIQPPTVPTRTAPQHLLAELPTYAAAERIVDTLADRGFPVEHCRIVGNGVRTVEHVTGRLTGGDAAKAGAASGAWMGLLFGLLFGLFAPGHAWLAVVLASGALSAVWMALFGYLAHRATGGRRDFRSVSSLEADTYSVYVDAPYADQAIRLSGQV